MSENLKVIATADASGVKKGMETARKSVKDFGEVSKDALSNVASLFGINTQEVEKLASAAQGLGAKLSKSGNEGAKALGTIISSAGAASVAIAAIGVGAIVTEFKALNAQAEAFKNTIQGANIELQTTAWIEVYRQAMRDSNAETGKAVAEFESQWEKTWARVKQFGETTLVGMFQNPGRVPGIAGGGLMAAAAVTQNAESSALPAAERAEELAYEIYQNHLKQLDLLPEIEKHNAAIVTAQAIIRDTSASVAERTEALSTATEQIRAKYAEQLELKTREYEAVKEMNSLSGTSLKDYEKEKTLAAEVERLKAQQAQEQAALVRYSNSVNRAAKEEADARKGVTSELQKQLELASQIIDKSIDRNVNSAVSGSLVHGADATAVLHNAMKNAEHLEIPAKLVFPAKETESSVKDLTDQVQSILGQGLADAGESIGTLIGTLAAGGDAWGNFATAALSAMGNMAISVGKLAISTGVATLGIKAALESLNGYAAIAAGVALVALGAAVKSGLSGISSGNYASSAGVVSSSSYSRPDSSALEARTVALEISGTLKADGDELIAVINKTGRRRIAIG